MAGADPPMCPAPAGSGANPLLDSMTPPPHPNNVRDP